MQNPVNLKRMAAEAAVDRVEDGMILGLGTGSTTRYAIEELGRRVGAGLRVRGVPTSQATAELAESVGIPLTTLEEEPLLDLTIDGADEVDPRLNLIKGMGGALFREKLVALCSSTTVIIVDEGKLVDFLGQRSPLPLEILPFGWKVTMERVQRLGCKASLRMMDDRPFLTDNRNYILDCRFPRIDEPEEMDERIKGTTGVLEHGLFLGLAETVLVGAPGGVRELRRP